MDPLKLLQKVEKVEAPPFLMTRIQAKIRAAVTEQAPVSWQWAGATALLLMFWLNFNAVSNTAPNNIAAEYGLHQTAQLYADEN
jgi:hypothetical protein